MTNEEFLFNMIRAATKEIEHQIKSVTNIPESVSIPGFDEGKLVGLSRSLELVNIALGLYETKVNVSKQ